MTQVVSALRLMGTVLLGATELVLVALFAMAVAANGLRSDEMGCLVLHSLVNILLWATEIYVVLRLGRDPHDIAYTIIYSLLVIITATAFALYAYHVAQVSSSELDFATLGASAAYAVLILSWLVTMLAIQGLIFAGADKCYVSSSAAKSATTEEHKKPTRNTNIDWSKRPLPLTIINVVHAGGPEMVHNPPVDVLPKAAGPGQLIQTPMRTTYSHWPGEV